MSRKRLHRGPDTFDVQGDDFTLRGVTKAETLSLKVLAETGGGEIKGTMAFDRKDYGMNSGIPILEIADRVEVTVNLTAKRFSRPPVALKR